MELRRGAHLLLMEANEEGITPLELARFLGDTAMAQQLEQHVSSLLKPNESLPALVSFHYFIAS